MTPSPEDMSARPLVIGLLSDTHLSRPTPEFASLVERCFAGVKVILHAGDLTELTVLSAFGDREVHAVGGNMCSAATRQALPAKKVINVGRFRLGLIHRAGDDYDFEARLPWEFDAVDAIVYGHTHRPVCQTQGGVLFVNPGAFQPTSRYGQPGTYALLTVGSGLSAVIREAPSA